MIGEEAFQHPVLFCLQVKGFPYFSKRLGRRILTGHSFPVALEAQVAESGQSFEIEGQGKDQQANPKIPFHELLACKGIREIPQAPSEQDSITGYRVNQRPFRRVKKA